MTIKDTSGPAFPTEHTDTSGQFDGMTLRDYFAAKAMTALIHVQVKTAQPITAETAYQWADAMLAERSKQ